MEYLKGDWLGRGWIDIESDLQDLIAGKIVEIYLNAFEHADSKVGIISCGQFYPDLKELKLTIIDFGVGIPYNVREYKKGFAISDAIAIKWALQRGASTKHGEGRGLGLDLLKEFIKLNSGSLEILSHTGYVLIDKEGESFTNRETHFEGTIGKR